MKKVLNGIERKESLKLLNEGKLGLITNHSGLTKDLTPSYVALNEKYNVTALFSPEHGIYGAAQAGAKVEEVESEEITGLPVYSLYSGKTAPDAQMLSDVDILCFDMQDVGARFYTYLYTMTRSMRSAAEKGIPFVVFDRVNPLGLDKVEGEILDEQYASFVGEYAVPHRYGLTIGEFAKYINAEKKIGADLYVVECDGLSRDMIFEDTDLCFVAPSPNMPTVNTANVYIGTCIFESAKNVSEGRGTTQPFETVGAPFIDERELCDYMTKLDLPGVLFRKTRFVPTFSKHAGNLCKGIQIHVTDKRRFCGFEVGFYLFSHIRELYEVELNEAMCKKVFGTSRLLDKEPADVVLPDCRIKCAEFKKSTERYWIYK